MWTRRLSELALFASLLTPALARAQPGDAMSAYRERFRHGMDRYRERAFEEAIADWEPIYAELGPVKGYRLGYDLGVAYSESGDPAHAIDRLQAFVAEAEARRARGEAIEAIVVKEEADARERLASLERNGAAPSEPAAPAPAPAPAPALEPALAPAPALESSPALAQAPAWAFAATPPPPPSSAGKPAFLPAAIAAAGGLALASAVAAVPLEAHAQALHDQYVQAQIQSPNHTIPVTEREAFSSARSLAYAAIGGAAGLGSLTAACAAWYFFAPPRREGTVAAVVGPSPHGASVTMSTAF